MMEFLAAAVARSVGPTYMSDRPLSGTGIARWARPGDSIGCDCGNLPEVMGTAAAGFADASIWEEAKKKGDKVIKAMIDDALKNTSVTVVCVTFGTAQRINVGAAHAVGHQRAGR